MNKRTKGLGIDCIQVERFLEFKNNREHSFIKKIFTQNEVDYCYSFEDPEIHLAGHFAMKEAVSKALGVKQYPFAEIEVRHDKEGAPEAWHNNEKLDIFVSISHTKLVGVAIAATLF